jgi:diguanylate cyclase (GGDEF)-like protein/PAS domain S-box-containing protein
MDSITKRLNSKAINYCPASPGTALAAATTSTGVTLIFTRDKELLQRLAASSGSGSLTVDCVSRFSQINDRLKLKGTVRALAVDLCALSLRQRDALRGLMLAAPNLPVLVIGDHDDPALQARLLAQGAQDFLLKSTLDVDGFRRAVHNCIARKAREIAVLDDRKRAQMTLVCIGDAVLSTDNRWLVTFINPVAEKLTGWSSAQAAGRHVSKVFQVLDGVTRARIVPQMELAVEKGRTIILPPNCVLVRRDGQELHIEDSAAPIHDIRGEFAGMVVVFHDVSESRALTEKMSHLAEHDALTSLPNRALLNDRLEHGITLARRNNRQMAVLFIDLDHFKHINDSLGHLIGDRILKAVAQRILPCIRNSDTVSRQGGDEFVVLLSEINRIEDAGVIAEKIRLALLDPFTIDDHYLHLTASIGVSVYPSDGEDASALIQYADTAMYHAKERGRNKSQFFEDHMNVRAAERQIISGDLRHALVRGEFFLMYQPMINLISGRITGFEALIRWRHPSRGVLFPASFIPIAEQCGLIMPIGDWVLRDACARARQWLEADLQFETIAVNISAVEFRSKPFFDGVCRILRMTGLEPRYLEIELTETAVMRDFKATNIILRALSAMGVRIAVDDFGTGYSNLSYLKRFPINTLKLDRSFVHDLPDSADASTIVSSVIRMAHGLHLQVVAEGVETRQQLKFLQTHSCAEAQGYYFGKPVGPDECQSLLRLKKQRWFRQFSPPSMSIAK